MRFSSANRRGALGAYGLLSAIWGTNFLFMQAAAPYISAGQTALLRLVFGAIPIVIFAALTGSFSRRHLRHAHRFIIQAFLGAGLYYFAYATGTFRLDSGIAGALSGSIPLFATVGAILIFRTEKLTAPKAAGVLLGAVGVVVIARPWNAASIDAGGVLWMLIGSASLGLSYGYARRFITPLGIPAAAAASYQTVLAAIGLALVTDLSGITDIAQDPGALTAVVLGLGVMGTGVVFVLYYIIVAALGAVTASTASYIPPVFAMAIGIIFLGEQFDAVALIGVALILGAAAIMQIAQRRSELSASQGLLQKQ
ncbi:DMT family transporter [Glutamicibacter sp.]|uniref:DMT family transporter n=1 Tax=Glutamicibacter sp. TaxID=1931995 RepID=UPI0028BEB311|nr:DMT family transporter [Glutamicibacter sp.]